MRRLIALLAVVFLAGMASSAMAAAPVQIEMTNDQ